MKLEVHIYHHDRALIERLDTTLAMLEAQMSALDDLKAEVERNTSLEQSAVVLIQGIGQQLRGALASNDTDALHALTDKLSNSADALAAAIAANTPAAPVTDVPASDTSNPA